ncbi:glucose-6-phosphate dehydrogenase assembly protein OpcA [Bifidobacterium sp.]|jgi:glucose-6-phosphate dehydrogenase assembly protein OpcA|uniref:glucose-6-phosphate dehydrogenase assembly protein OpcA n=1 Tax=Bifidobacterium sp. TaxID=41200 RepID=UPI0025BE7F02|nr:glucose-6-phosphate dehydrogenase assembly protein OpcA [Bifidobacterium sp.]MCH4160389.1 glucose-6-phosphate dehydrogenase assembly protein OpcA [Bifidobacterium sp.]MCH4175351.1 glucose-6-phosphate dehydrogenase assembly protein OpcA [Bifidobacterium sp.]MCI1636454.1 glucose-6-phosphate dehydrogenase assembly protein OpcA [Bifidobacterium sp.]
MIVEMPDTATSQISRKIDALHEERGEAALGRVLTLLISTSEEELEESLETANAASREHPCRVIAIVTDGSDSGEHSKLDAQVRFGADAGAGEIVVLKPFDGLKRHLDTLVIPLLVPDAPVVAWWPSKAPEDPSKDPIGRMARSRITDAIRSSNPDASFTALRAHWSCHDIDMSWTRLTVWRAMLASMLDQPPHLPIKSVRVKGQSHYIPLDLLAAWLAVRLDVPVTIERDDDLNAITGVFFEREDGELSMERPYEDQATICQPGESQQDVAMPMRTLEECLSEEMRRLDPDEVYAEVITDGWGLVDHE